MKTGIALIALLIAAAFAITPAAVNNVEVTVIGSNGQPIRDMYLYLVPNNNDTNHAIDQERTDSNGKATLSANITTDGTYWVVGKAPVVYSSVDLTTAGANLTVTFMLNDTSAYRNVTFLAVLDNLPDSSVVGNLTLRTADGSVKVIGAPLTLNIVYFPSSGSDIGATLEISREVRKLGSTYTLVNITVHFHNDTKAGYNVTSYDIDPSVVKGITVFYKSTGTFFGLDLTTWIAIGILLAAAGGFIAVARSRRAAMAVMKERRTLRSSGYMVDNGTDWHSLINGSVPLEERMKKARRALRRA